MERMAKRIGVQITSVGNEKGVEILRGENKELLG